MKTQKYIQNKIYEVEGEFYYIENNRYINNVLQKPIIITFNKLGIHLQNGLFKDNEGNRYQININNIFDNKEEMQERYDYYCKQYEERILKPKVTDWYK